MTVDHEDAQLLALARANDDEAAIDWHAEENSVQGAEAKAVLSELRVLHDVARVSRDPDSEMTIPALTGELGDGESAQPAGRWGSLTVFEEIGRGAFSRVYRARDSLGRDVALKLFRDPTDSARLLREGQLLARIRNPNVIVVHGAAEVDGQVGLWMELIRGRTLEDELKTRGAFSAEEARLIGLDLCRALAAVHEAGLVHRDVKTQNVMREQGGRIVLMDFGAGIATEAGVQRDVAGTPMYLAPEVYAGHQASCVSDIYSLGVLLYHLVTGVYPVSGRNRSAIAQAHSEGRIKRLRDARPDLPGEFVHVVEAALASDVHDRYQTAGDLEHALRNQSDPVPIPRKPLWQRWQIASVAVVAVAVAAILIFSRKPSPDDSIQSAREAVSRVLPSPSDASYTVRGEFYKYSTGRRIRLAQGDRVTPGDGLGFQIEASIPVFVYVVNEDDHGEAYLLFPLPGQESSNPLRAGIAHELPGGPDGQEVHWQITSAGGREHFVIFVSPSHMAVFDGLLKSLPPPLVGRPVTGTRLLDLTVSRLRGVGGLTSQPSAKASSAHYLFQGVDPLSTNTDTARGVWSRQLTLENPGP